MPAMEILATIAQLGAAQGFILAVAILPLRYGHRIANRILAVFLVVQALRLVVLSLTYNPDPATDPRIFQLLHLSYCYGPLLYFYVRLLVDQHYRLRLQSLWHFTPVVAAALVLWPGGLFIDADLTSYGSFENLPEQAARIASLATVPVYISLFIYSALAWRQLKRHRARIREQFSALELINLNWLRALVAFCLLAAMINGPVELIRALTGWELGPRVAASTALSVLMICYIGIMGLRQPAIFDQGQRGSTAPQAPPQAPVAEDSSALTESSPEKIKYEKSALDEAHIDRIWQKLQQHIKAQRPYLQAGVKLADLAAQINTLPNYLSQTINRRAGQNFFEFINSYRLQAARELLESQPDMSVSDVALSSGFNSQNVFNGHFKKATGETPTQYRKKLFNGKTV